MRYNKKKGESAVLNEVHFYIPADSTAKLNKDYSFMLDKVQKIEVLEKDKGRTTTSYILGGAGAVWYAGNIIYTALNSWVYFY